MSSSQLLEFGQHLPVNLPSLWRDLAFKYMASRTRVAACCETECCDSVRDRPFLEGVFSAIEGCNRSMAACRSMPSNTRRAPSRLPLWYSNFPRRALASCQLAWNRFFHFWISQNQPSCTTLICPYSCIEMDLTIQMMVNLNTNQDFQSLIVGINIMKHFWSSNPNQIVNFQGFSQN